MRTSSTALLSLLASSAAALAPPNYPGCKTLWSDSFMGSSGDIPSKSNWNTITKCVPSYPFLCDDNSLTNPSFKVNNEVQDYVDSIRNIQISGGGTVQLVPVKDADGRWTSGRLESKYTFTPEAGKVTAVEAVLRFGDNDQSNKKGMWPAFWLLGDSMRHGTPWPQCGEIDIMETVNGAAKAYGTVHCGWMGGGPCNEPIGRATETPLADYGWHRWTVQIDRTNAADWRAERIQWFLDGQVFNTVSGADIGDQAVWSTLAHSPLYIIMNVAVGGSW